MTENKQGQGFSITDLFSLFLKRKKPPADELPTTSVEAYKHGDFVWTDAQDPTSEFLEDTGQKYDIQAVYLNKSPDISHMARVEMEDGYLFLLLNLPYVDEGSGRILTQQVMAFLGKEYLITIHSAKTPTVRQAFDEYKTKSKGKSDSSARMLLFLIDKILEDIGVLAQSVSSELDAIEESVFDNDASDALRISQLRRKIMRLRRTLSAQKNVLEDLDAMIDKFTGERLERYYTAHTNRSIKLWETLEEAKETIEIYKDADFTSSQERNKQILAILTIVFTLGIPATILGTFYGMNIPLPGGIETGSWRFFGEYTTFIIMVSISVAAAIGMWLYFKRKRWF